MSYCTDIGINFLVQAVGARLARRGTDTFKGRTLHVLPDCKSRRLMPSARLGMPDARLSGARNTTSAISNQIRKGADILRALRRLDNSPALRTRASTTWRFYARLMAALVRLRCRVLVVTEHCGGGVARRGKATPLPATCSAPGHVRATSPDT